MTLTPSQSQRFQDNILRTILQLEKTFFDMAEEDQGNVLIVCDRGAMDPSACECVCVCECYVGRRNSSFWYSSTHTSHQSHRKRSGGESWPPKGWTLSS